MRPQPSRCTAAAPETAEDAISPSHGPYTAKSVRHPEPVPPGTPNGLRGAPSDADQPLAEPACARPAPYGSMDTCPY
ncbi:hypothetical protein ACIOMQ_19845 [Streptomyces sp. NPDC087845]|uniref:hypothetical protein n=1 Tax=Streptomyces sp. NPDC087845 TaxID=3365806 RepID=UPI003827E8A0